MKRRWKEGHEIAAAVLCPFVQSEGDNHANQKIMRKQGIIPYQDDLGKSKCASVPQAAPVCAKTGDARKQNPAPHALICAAQPKRIVPTNCSSAEPSEKGEKPVVPIEIFSGAPHSRCARQENLAHPQPWLAARFYPCICRLACQQPVHGARTKCGRHFAGFVPAAHPGCSRICGDCGNDC